MECELVNRPLGVSIVFSYPSKTQIGLSCPCQRLFALLEYRSTFCPWQEGLPSPTSLLHRWRLSQREGIADSHSEWFPPPKASHTLSNSNVHRAGQIKVMWIHICLNKKQRSLLPLRNTPFSIFLDQSIWCISGFTPDRQRDFPGGPVVKTPGFQCRGRGFNPWSGNKDPTSCMVRPKKKYR